MPSAKGPSAKGPRHTDIVTEKCKVSEYDQELPQSQTAVHPKAPKGRDREQ